MADDMFQDLEEKPSDGFKVDLSTILGTGLLASIGAGFVWTVNNAMKIQDMFENPIFMVFAFIVMMVFGGLILYLLYSRPRERERLLLKKSLKAAVVHAQKCDVELAEVKREFLTVAKFIDGYSPSFQEAE